MGGRAPSNTSWKTEAGILIFAVVSHCKNCLYKCSGGFRCDMRVTKYPGPTFPQESFPSNHRQTFKVNAETELQNLEVT